MKSRIVLLLDSLATGGEEKSAVSLVERLRAIGCEVTVLMLQPGGTFMGELPKDVRVVPMPFTPDGALLFRQGLKRTLKYGLTHPWKLTLLAKCLVSCLLVGIRNRELRQCFEMQRWLNRKALASLGCDVLMAYSSRLQLHMIGAKFIPARKKILWLHCELENSGFNPKPFLRYWKSYDVWAAAASDKIMSDYGATFPDYVSRIIKLPLFVSAELCRRRAAEGDGLPIKNGEVRLLSVGRLAYQKGFDMAIRVAERLKSDGLKFVWSIVGDGRERSSLQDEIDRRLLGDVVRLLGNRANPYPCFASCDVYVQPSRYEGYCITLAEARAFARPIVTTGFAGAREQIRHGENGIIVQFKEEELYSAIRNVILDASLRKKLSSSLARSNVQEAALNDRCLLEALG